KGKDFATSLGPIVVTRDEFDGTTGTMIAHVNGEERSHGNLADMHHSWETIVAHAARNTHLRPGDVLGSGTVGQGCILEHGIVRLAYPEPEFVELAKEAFAGWRELERESGEQLLELNGLLELVERPEQSSQDALAAAGTDYELLTAVEARARWLVGVPAGWTALFQPEAGIVRADRAHRA